MVLPLGLSYRRMFLDAELERLASELGGVVLEIGAKRVARGRWRPPLDRARRWVRLNLEAGQRPDGIRRPPGLPPPDPSAARGVGLPRPPDVVSPRAPRPTAPAGP